MRWAGACCWVVRLVGEAVREQRAHYLSDRLSAACTSLRLPGSICR